jgi:plastocyanin
LESCPAGTAATDFSSEGSFTVTIKKFAFHPICIIAGSDGPIITIANKDTDTHNFSMIGTGIDVLIPGGHAKTKTARLAPGTYTFYCNIHQAMTPGTLIVVP